MVPYEVQSSEAQGVQTPPANWICPACFLTALPFADASILSDEGEYYAETLNTSDLSNTRANSLPEVIKSRNDDDREILVMHLNINGVQNKFELK